MARLLLDARLQRVKEFGEKCAASAEDKAVRSNLPTIGNDRAVGEMRLIQKLRQRAQQGRLWSVNRKP